MPQMILVSLTTKMNELNRILDIYEDKNLKINYFIFEEKFRK